MLSLSFVSLARLDNILEVSAMITHVNNLHFLFFSANNRTWSQPSTVFKSLALDLGLCIIILMLHIAEQLHVLEYNSRVQQITLHHLRISRGSLVEQSVPWNPFLISDIFLAVLKFSTKIVTGLLDVLHHAFFVMITQTYLWWREQTCPRWTIATGSHAVTQSRTEENLNNTGDELNFWRIVLISSTISP